MSRYHKNKANVITSQDYDRVMRERGAEGSLGSGSSVEEMEKYIDDALKGKKCIPVNRCIGGVAYGDRQAVLASFYEENSPRHSCLSRSAQWMGTVIYCSTGNKVWSSGSSTLQIDGYVDMAKNHRLLECPLKFTSGANNVVPEINRFRYEIANDPDFDNKMLQKFTETGLDQGSANILLEKIKSRIRDDIGFCGMLMGYDAIYGLGFQFDILNLDIWNIVKG